MLPSWMEVMAEAAELDRQEAMQGHQTPPCLVRAERDRLASELELAQLRARTQFWAGVLLGLLGGMAGGLFWAATLLP